MKYLQRLTPLPASWRKRTKQRNQALSIDVGNGAKIFGSLIFPLHRFGGIDSCIMLPPPATLSALNRAERARWARTVR